MSKEWDRANLKSLGVNMRKEDVEAFKKYAEDRGTTAGALLRGFVQATLDGNTKYTPPYAVGPGVAHEVSFKNTDRLKHEVAFYNPKGLTPDEMLNDILDNYFAFVKKARTKG